MLRDEQQLAHLHLFSLGGDSPDAVPRRIKKSLQFWPSFRPFQVPVFTGTAETVTNDIEHSSAVLVRVKVVVKLLFFASLFAVTSGIAVMMVVMVPVTVTAVIVANWPTCQEDSRRYADPRLTVLGHFAVTAIAA